MKLYIAILEDRHTGVEAETFTTAEKAIAFAKSSMIASAAWSDEIEEQEIEGYLYFATYSTEGDCVRVVESELDPEGSDA